MKNQGLGIRNWGLAITLAMLVVSQSDVAASQKVHEGEASLRITVRVYDYVSVEKDVMAGAQKEAASILATAGIETEWLNCSANWDEGQTDGGCARPFARSELVMRILTKAMAAKLPFRNTTLGFATLTEEGGHGYLGGVFYHKVEQVAKEIGTDRHHILAHAIAHEIGHLLLRTAKHGHSGLMRANWGPDDLELARRGQLPFTSEEAARLRAEARARVHSKPMTVWAAVK